MWVSSATVWSNIQERRPGLCGRLAALLVCAMVLPGCSISMPMGSFLSRSEKTAEKQDDDNVTTSSIASRQTSATVPAVLSDTKSSITVPIPAEDWDFAKKALIEALSSREETPSVPWDNARSGTRGTITTLIRSGGPGGTVCRGFLGSAIKDKAETWFEGRACRLQSNEWEVQDLRPWKRV